jgi:hypothetical protein
MSIEFDLELVDIFGREFVIKLDSVFAICSGIANVHWHNGIVATRARNTEATQAPVSKAEAN